MPEVKIEVCPNCRFTLVDPATYCPYCGVQLTAPLWKKTGAWILLFLTCYLFLQCNLRLMKGL
ncbi:MAG: zinc-ribbon domain-containing protein [Acidobacteria bacterium]|nr:zinc-ribbon domain-containing protein [Acidobacteriota bacterium]